LKRILNPFFMCFVLIAGWSQTTADSRAETESQREERMHWWTEARFGMFIHWGPGRHGAALNFGDCMSYATAQLSQQPLLCTGDDFSHTDLRLVQP
jgi:uncharacterized protein with PIN domain